LAKLAPQDGNIFGRFNPQTDSATGQSEHRHGDPAVNGHRFAFLSAENQHVFISVVNEFSSLAANQGDWFGVS
jgi:hypothetical protein